jgi:hypothetical protein
MQTVPVFPLFHNVELSDRITYDEFYKQLKPYSDFSFNNLWVWFNQKGGLAWSRHQGNLILRFNNPFDAGALEYSILGNQNCGATIDRLLRWQHAMGLEQKIVMVPQIVIDTIGTHTTSFEYIEDLDNRDYIYDVAIMDDALGRTYMKYRHALSYFRNHYSAEMHIDDIDLRSADQRAKLADCLHRWQTPYRQANQEVIEGGALKRLLVYADELPVKCLGLYMDGVLESFLLYQITPQGDYAIANHLKCNNAYNYIFDMTVSQFIKKLRAAGISYLNLEQDLGLPGLRTHKERLRPAAHLNRYTITSL